MDIAEFGKPDMQARAEWDRILVCRLNTQLAPHFIKNRAGASALVEQMQEAVIALYDGNPTRAMTATWVHAALIMRMISDIQGQCDDKRHALEILRLLRYTIDWQYQPGVQGKVPYEGSLRIVRGDRS